MIAVMIVFACLFFLWSGVAFLNALLGQGAAISVLGPLFAGTFSLAMVGALQRLDDLIKKK